MIIQRHTKAGVKNIDSDTVTDAELAGLKLDRVKLAEILTRQPRDFGLEIDLIKDTLAVLYRLT